MIGVDVLLASGPEMRVRSAGCYLSRPRRSNSYAPTSRVRPSLSTRRSRPLAPLAWGPATGHSAIEIERTGGHCR
jgi:hypothetical protein